MTFSDIIRRTRFTRRRNPKLDLRNQDHSASTAADPDIKTLAQTERGGMQVQGQSGLNVDNPYLNRPSEEFFTRAINYPDEFFGPPDPSLSSSPNMPPSEPFIGIALGYPEANSQSIYHTNETQKGEVFNSGRSLDSSVNVQIGLVDDEFKAGIGDQKGSKWAGFAGYLGAQGAALDQKSEYGTGQKSVVSPNSYSSDWQEALEKAPQYQPPPEWETSTSFPRAMERQSPPKIGITKKPSLIKPGKLLRKLSRRPNSSRKLHAQVKPNYDTENLQPWLLSPSSPVAGQSVIKTGGMNRKTLCSNLGVVSLLHIDIPHIEMERYSVMFASLLPATEQPSLLARRQGPLATIRLATETRTKSLRRNMLLSADHLIARPTASSPHTLSPMPTPSASVPTLARSRTTNAGFKRGSFLHRSYTTTTTSSQPRYPKAEHSEPPHLVVMVHRSNPSPHDDEILPPKTPNSSTAQNSKSSSSSPVELPCCTSSLPSTVSSPRRTPIRTPTSTSSRAAVPITRSLSSITPATKISITRQISMTRIPRDLLVVPVVSSQRQRPTESKSGSNKIRTLES